MLYENFNRYAESCRPYMGRFINHLPMAQLALYRMTGDLDRVETYSAYREAKTFSRQVDGAAFSVEMNSLTGAAPIQRILPSNSSLGQRLKAL